MLTDKRDRILMSLVAVAVVVAIFSMCFLSFREKNQDEQKTTVVNRSEMTEQQRFMSYAVENGCTRTKLEGVIWWQCNTNGWWEESELMDLANGRYHFDPTTRAELGGSNNEPAKDS